MVFEQQGDIEGVLTLLGDVDGGVSDVKFTESLSTSVDKFYKYIIAFHDRLWSPSYDEMF